ncbi:MAG: ABC transporter permease subunit, partial [Actinobacteria bacterium]|nr:ABC transporter permease subunit [Actinomycetota bacterium]
MNIFIRELKAHSRSLLIWSLSMVALVAAGMMKFSALSTDTQALEALMKQFPASIQAVFGMTGLDLATVSGYYGILYLYLALLLAIHAGLLGEELFTKEEREKTTEFLYVRPVSRAGAITAKLCAGLCVVALLNIVTMVSSYGSIAGFVDPVSVREELLLFMAALAIIQLVFFF